MPIKDILKHFIEAFKLQFVCLIGGVLTWGRRVPASALPTWGSMPQVGNTWSIDIHVFVSQGLEPWLTNADAGTRRPQVRAPPN